MDLTEAQWQVLKPLLTPKRRPDGRGRPWRDARAVLNGILWVLRTGAPWHDLPDRDPLDQRLRQKHRIRLIAPHKYNRYRKNTQDGRELRRYCRRWKIERLFAWLHNFRRLVSSWEYHEANFLGMLQLGCLVILLSHL